MNVREKYDNTINRIEELSLKGEKDLHAIAQIVAQENALSVRDMTTLFNYFMEMTFKNYILGRKLNAAYQCLIQQDKANRMNQAISLAGYSDQPSFTRAFKRKFGVLPGEVSKLNDDSKLEEPATWDTLVGNQIDQKDNLPEEHSGKCPVTTENAVEKESITDTINKSGELVQTEPLKTIVKKAEEPVGENITKKVFGISEKELETALKALEFESFYGLPRMLSEYAYNLSVEKGYSLEDCFEYADSLHEYGDDFEPDPDEYEEGEQVETAEEILHDTADNDTIQEIFFARKISVSAIVDLTMNFGATKEQLMECDNDMLEKFPGRASGAHFSFDYYLKAYVYFTENYHGQCENEEEAFDYYVDKLDQNYPIEDAFEYAITEQKIDEGLNEMGSDLDFEIDWEFERNEMERYAELDRMEDEMIGRNAGRIDDDLYYDSDNAGYDDSYGGSIFF